MCKKSVGRLLFWHFSRSVLLHDSTSFNGETAEIVEESSISSIIPDGTQVTLTLKDDKINVFTPDGSRNLTSGVTNDAE